jgi:hypothetical protein
MEEGKWVTSKEAVHEYAIDNDGSCVIAMAEYFEDHDLSLGQSPYATCCFTSPDAARERSCGNNWTWYFTDEPYIEDKWGLDGELPEEEED